MEENLIFVWNIIKVALGLGFVIFVHELGHFLLAKWNGVRVDRFSIGFGRTLVSFRRGVGFRVGTGSRPPGPNDPPTYGETEYVLAVLPLGGYVKMLGESLEDQSEKVVKSEDPRAFNQKTVFARMQIITAGVIMNFFLAVLCFAFVHSQGGKDVACKIGSVLPGSPAFKAGLRPGDEIVAIDGLRDIGYKELMHKVSLSGAGQKINFTIRRLGSDAEESLAIEPLRGENIPFPTIGIQSSLSLELQTKFPFQALPGQKPDTVKPQAGFKGDDLVVAIGPAGGKLEPVKKYDEFIEKLDRLRDRPIVVEVERKKIIKDGVEEKTTEDLTVPVNHFLDFGFRLTPGPIAAIRNDSPAQRAGLKEGDRIIAIDGLENYDPMQLPDMARASAGKPMKLTIGRPVDGKATTLEITVTPEDSPTWMDQFDPILRPTPLDVPGLGLALAVEPKIRAVADGSPAAKAGLKAGDVLKSIIIAPKKFEDEKSDPKPITIELDQPTSGWPVAFNVVQQIPARSIQVTIQGSSKPIPITPTIDEKRFHPIRGLDFDALRRDLPPQGFAESMRRGLDETIERALGVIFIFRGISQGRVGKDAFVGVGPIAKVAYLSAKDGWIPFISFLGVVSVNLAVLNFLPIPPLDGGQFLFLTAEKIRGKPLPERALNFLMIVGVAVVLFLIVFINGKDLWGFIKGYF